MKRILKSPDSVCAVAAERKVKLNVQKLPGGYLLIEGNQEALKFLARLLEAQATFEKDCGFSLHPKEGGKIFFSKKAKLGIYIHRVPCIHETRARSGRNLTRYSIEPRARSRKPSAG